MVAKFVAAGMAIAIGAIVSIADNAAYAKSATSPFIEVLGATAPPAGYIEMCRQGGSLFCPPAPEPVSFASQDAAAITSTGGIAQSPVRAMNPLHSSPSIAWESASFASGSAPLDILPTALCAIDTLCPKRNAEATNFGLGQTLSLKQSMTATALDAAWAIAFPDLSQMKEAPLQQPALTATLAVLGEPLPSLFDVDQPMAAMPAPEPAIVRDGQRNVASATLRRLLKKENFLVNSQVRQETDLARFGQEERWARSNIGVGASGDCEDIAIEKRIRLIEAGFPAERLSFGVVYRPDVGLHAILVAHLDTGDYVLDSLSPFVQRWDKIPYSWVSVQNLTHPGNWSTVSGPRQVESAQKVQYRIIVSS